MFVRSDTTARDEEVADAARVANPDEIDIDDDSDEDEQREGNGDGGESWTLCYSSAISCGLIL